MLAFAELDDGTVWSAGYGGIQRHDGFRTTAFTSNSPVPLPTRPANVFCATATGPARLWIGFGGPRVDLQRSSVRGGAADAFTRPGLLSWENGAWRMVEGDLTRSPVWALAKDETGVWIGTEQGLQRWERGRFLPIARDPSFGDNRVTALITAGLDEIWVGSSTGLARGERRDGQWSFRATDVRAAVAGLAHAPDGAVLAATASGLFVLAPPSFAPRAVAELAGQVLHAVAVAPDGAVWAGGADGLWRGQAGAWGRLHPSSARGDEGVTALHFDRDGTAWIGLRSGRLVRARAVPFRTVTEADGLPSSVIRAVLADPGRGVWVATSAGLALVHDHQGVVLDHALPAAAVPGSLARGADGSVWVALGHKGIARVPPVSAADQSIQVWPASPATGAVRAVVPSLTAAAPEVVLVLNDDGGVERHELAQGKLTPGRRIPASALCGEPIALVVAAAGGGFWLGDEQGALAHIDAEGAAACRSVAPSEQKARVTSLVEAARGVVWAGLERSRGLVRFDGKARRAFRERQGLPCESIHGLAVRDAGSLWVGCGGGVAIVPSAALAALGEGQAIPTPPLFARQHGLPANEVSNGFHPAVAVDGEGRAWFATLAGAFVTRDDLFVARGRRMPRLSVAEAVVDGRRVHRPRVIEATSPTSIDVQLALTGTAIEGTPVVSWSLEGRDDHSVRLEPDGLVRLGKVAPGRYTLAAKANWPVLGWTRKEPVIEVRIVPPWFERRLIWVAFAAALVAAGCFAHWLRLRKMRRVQALIDDERGKVARDLHDGLGQVFASLGFQLEALRRVIDRGDDGASRRIVGNIASSLAVGHERARRTIWTLRARTSPSLDLTAALRQVVDDARETVREGGPDIELAARGRTNARSAPSDVVAHELVAIVAELVSNAIAHARATRITVGVEFVDGGGILTVADDGVGLGGTLDSFAAGGRLGLLGARERAARIDAELEVDTAPGRGTRWTLSLSTLQDAA